MIIIIIITIYIYIYNVSILLNLKKMIFDDGHIDGEIFGLTTTPLGFHYSFDITSYISKNAKRYHYKVPI